MKNMKFFTLAFIILFFGSCIGDDIIEDRVDPVVRISNPVDSIELNTTYQFEANFFNNVGKAETQNLVWSSSDVGIIEISESGLANAKELGIAIISVDGTATSGELVHDERMVVVGNSTTVVTQIERTGTIATTSSYQLEGDFSMENINGVLTLSFADNYRASTALPGLYVYLTNNPTTTSGAYEIGKVEVFSGAHTYEFPSSVDIMDYEYVLYFCKPFSVKVGDGQMSN